MNNVVLVIYFEEFSWLIANLPDLNTENEFVIAEFNSWIQFIVREYNFDAIRIDTVKHVRKTFWSTFSKSSGVFSIGEILHGDPKYVGPYQNYMDSTFNYPLYFTINGIWNYLSWKFKMFLWRSNQCGILN